MIIITPRSPSILHKVYLISIQRCGTATPRVDTGRHPTGVQSRQSEILKQDFQCLSPYTALKHAVKDARMYVENPPLHFANEPRQPRRSRECLANSVRELAVRYFRS